MEENSTWLGLEFRTLAVKKQEIFSTTPIVLWQGVGTSQAFSSLPSLIALQSLDVYR
jgi:hypothetical protein